MYVEFAIDKKMTSFNYSYNKEKKYGNFTNLSLYDKDPCTRIVLIFFKNYV